MNDGTVIRIKATNRGRVGMSLEVSNVMTYDICLVDGELEKVSVGKRKQPKKKATVGKI